MAELGAFIGASTTGWGAFGALTFFLILAFFRRWIVPASQVKDLLSRADQRVEDYKEIGALDRATIATLNERLSVTTDVARTTKRVLDAVTEE